VPVVAGESASAQGAWYNFVSPEYSRRSKFRFCEAEFYARRSCGGGASGHHQPGDGAAVLAESGRRGQSIHIVRDTQVHTQNRVLRHESIRVIALPAIS